MAYFATVKTDLGALNDLSKRWGKVADRLSGDKTLANRLAREGAEIIVGAIRSGLQSSVSSRKTASVRTGALSRSFREEFKVSAKDITMRGVSDSEYAAIQDRGGRIYPKTRKALAIPLIAMAVGKWPRHWDEGVLFRVGNVLARKKGKRSIQNVYALVKSVRIEPKNYIKTAQEEATPEVGRLFLTEVLGEVKRGN